MQAESLTLRSAHQRPVLATRARLEIPLGSAAEEGTLTFAPGWEFAWTWDEGLKIAGSAHLRWPALGIRTPILLGRVGLEVRSSLLTAVDGEDQVVVGLALDDASNHDVRPLQSQLVERLNDAIRVKSVPGAWLNDEATGRWLALPATLDALSAVGVDVPPSRVVVTRDAHALVTAFVACEPTPFDPLRQREER